MRWRLALQSFILNTSSYMTLTNAVRQVSAGTIVGLSAVIYSISYGALLFSGPLSKYIGYGISIALITAIIGALFGLLSDEGTFISGPDSNTIAGMAGAMAILTTFGIAETETLQVAIEIIVCASVISGIAFYLIAHFRLSGFIRYIPFSVMAGFLAATGWLMSSGSLNIIAGTPLTMVGLHKLIDHPLMPHFYVGISVALILFWLSSYISTAILIPITLIVVTIVINLFILSGFCSGEFCSKEYWLFTQLKDNQWLPPWGIDFRAEHLRVIFEILPTIAIVSFVGLLTILLSIASLELNSKKEFELDKVVKAHGTTSFLGAIFGGFIGIISISRTTLNQSGGGGKLSGLIASLICLAFFLGAGNILAYIPRAALGGLILFLGIGMLKQWLWDQRHVVSKIELAQIFLILFLVANFGYLYGFAAGMIISCFIFVITYSQLGLAFPAANLSEFSSSLVRSEGQVNVLKNQGEKIAIYRLNGYVFFGSASKIDAVFKSINIDLLEGVIIDFSYVSGIDRSAISVFQRILRRYAGTKLHFYLVYSDKNQDLVQSIAPIHADIRQVSYLDSLDNAIVLAEEGLINDSGLISTVEDTFNFLDSPLDRENFKKYCVLNHAPTNQIIAKEGDLDSGEIYFLESGELGIGKWVDGKSLTLARFLPGSIVGEISFYTHSARTATIQTLCPSSFYMLNFESLEKMRLDDPALATQLDLMVIKKLSNSLQRSNKLLATLVQKPN